MPMTEDGKMRGEDTEKPPIHWQGHQKSVGNTEGEFSIEPME